MVGAMKRLGLLAAMFTIGCGGDGENTPDPDGPVGSDASSDGPAADGPAGTFTLTSTAFLEGQTIPTAHTCDGANTSPQLDWVDPPAGALSFAVVLVDLSFNNFHHSVIYDIPASRTGLPADIDKVFEPSDVPGAKQTRSFNNGPNGYRGPCPPEQHTYELAIYALDVAALPELTMTSTAAQGEAAILMHDLAKATLTGTYERP